MRSAIPCFEIQSVNLNRAASGMGGLGIDRLGNIAFTQIQHDPVGVADSGIQLSGQIRRGDFIGTASLDNSHQLLNSHGGQIALAGNFCDIRKRVCGDDHPMF